MVNMAWCQPVMSVKMDAFELLKCFAVPQLRFSGINNLFFRSTAEILRNPVLKSLVVPLTAITS